MYSPSVIFSLVKKMASRFPSLSVLSQGKRSKSRRPLAFRYLLLRRSETGDQKIVLNIVQRVISSTSRIFFGFLGGSEDFGPAVGGTGISETKGTLSAGLLRRVDSCLLYNCMRR
jgi:hypothetical protein